MKLFKIPAIAILLILLFSFNTYAMNNVNNVFTPATPENESENINYRWTWLNDELCVQFNPKSHAPKSRLEDSWNNGMLSRWIEYSDGKYQAKIRDIYSGKWNQSPDGIWSFEFNDKTIPVGATKIDGVVYAFNSYGELSEGYEYYAGLKTAADGLVTADSAEFTQWITTQYLPDCTSHE